jgi:hypothetical protein
MSDGVQEDGLARPSVLKTKAIYIIATEFCERLAYYGFAGSLVLFFETVLKLSNEDSVNQFYIWNGFVYMTPLIGGYVADTYWSRYRTIQVFAAMYLIGLIMFNIGTIPGTNSVALVFLAIYIIALGAGGIKPNVSTLGADQFEVLKYDQDLKESKKFFSWFYWVINLGALVSYTIIGFCCQYGVPFLGGRDWGFFVGMLIATIAMAFGLGAFMSGSQSYTIKQPEGSMLSTFIGILRQAIGNKSANSSRSTASTELLSGDDGSEKGGGEGGKDNSGQSLWQKNALPPSWLDAASTTNGGTYSPAFIGKFPCPAFLALPRLLRYFLISSFSSPFARSLTQSINQSINHLIKCWTMMLMMINDDIPSRHQQRVRSTSLVSFPSSG